MHNAEHLGPTGDRAPNARATGTSGATPAYPSRGRAAPSNGTAGTAAGPALRPTTELRRDHETWLLARGLDSEVISRCGVVTAESATGGDWIAIPYRVNGQTVNHKYRCLNDKRFAQDKGGKQVWWNADAITDPTLADRPLVITEGELDAMAAMSAGFVRVVSVPGGAPQAPTDSDGKYAYLADSFDALRQCREIIIAADGDGPGVALLQDLSTRLGKGRCKYLTYQPGCKDLNDVLLGYGAGAVVDHIQAAKWVKVTGLFRMSELPPVPDAKAYDPPVPGLAQHYRLRKGDFAVITGIPGMGKSTLVNDLTCSMAHQHGWSTVFASFEQNPQVDHLRALRTWHAHKPAEQMDARDIARADMWIDRYFSFVVPDEDEDADLDWLLDKLAAAVIRFGADIAVIDPWNEVDHMRPKELSLTEYVGLAIRKLKKFARKLNVHLIVVAHPQKLSRDRDGKTPVPTLYDISDSAHWFNKPDIGLIVHAAKDELSGRGYTLLRVAKSRYHDRIGKPGDCKVVFDPTTAKYEAYL